MGTPNVQTVPNTDTVNRLPRFPRKGAFVLVAGALAIIVSLGRRGRQTITDQAPDGTPRPITRDYVDASEPYAEVHLVDTREGHKNFGGFRRAPDDFPIGDVQDGSEGRGSGGEVFNVPFSELVHAPWSIVGAVIDARNGSDPRPSNLWARRMGYPLTDAEASELPALEEAERIAREQAAAIAAHPHAQTVEDQIEAERVAFVERATKMREDAARAILDGTAPEG